MYHIVSDPMSFLTLYMPSLGARHTPSNIAFTGYNGRLLPLLNPRKPENLQIVDSVNEQIIIYILYAVQRL